MSCVEPGIRITSRTWGTYCNPSEILSPLSGALIILVSSREISLGWGRLENLTEETLLNDPIFLKLEGFVLWAWKKL